MRSRRRQGRGSRRTAACCSPLCGDARTMPARSSTPRSRTPPPGGEGLAVQYAQWTTAILYNGLGRYEDALAAAQQATEVTPELFIAVWALPELIEAAIRSGNADLARSALERLVE